MATARNAQLIAINEALRCLDHDTVGEAEGDDLVSEAIDLLIDARSRLTDKPWPEFAAIPAVDRGAWLDARRKEQAKDGRL